MKKQMFVFTFPIWNRGEETITGDAQTTAETQEEAIKQLWQRGVDKDWIIGDCRHCAYG